MLVVSDLDGIPLPYNGPNGWRLNNQSRLELLGEASKALLEGGYSQSASFPCHAVTVHPAT